jgi:hypothetical protein
MKAVDFFARDVHTFWATTFQFDFKLFDQFLLRRLGKAPLNAVVLCDQDCLSETLGKLSDVDIYVTANANRRYLLRGVRVPSGGRFHPKTYLFASRRRTVLLVGSGNLTRSGLDRGRETFVAYDGSDPEDLPVIFAWADWMGALVRGQADSMLSQRFDRLRAALPVLGAPTDEKTLLVNNSASLLDQFAAIAPTPVTELHVRAPYYDEKALALAKLISRLAPTKAVHVHLGARTNVDGRALRHILGAVGCAVHLHGLEPSEFVHAKLIGAIGANGKGVLMCGSANLSNAALNEAYDSPSARGNCEVVVLRRGSRKAIAGALTPPNSMAVDISMDDLVKLHFEADESEVHVWPIRLRSAAFFGDGRIHVEVDGELDNGSLFWEEASRPLALGTDGVSEEAVPEQDDPQIVWLVDQSGERCSNPVVVDDRNALNQILGDSERASDRPNELLEEDERSQLVSLLTWANQRFIFDIDDTSAIRRANNAQELQPDAEDTGFWERYAREELEYDPRSQTYRRLGSAGGSSEADVLIREITTMLQAAPADRRLRLTANATKADQEEGPSGGHPWSFTARERLRARNLLRRWARALCDPRHAWLSPEAPARNYEALLEVLTLIWLASALEDRHVEDLLGEMWASFIGSENRRGFLERADDELLAEALGSLSDDARQLAAGLAYSALHPTDTWQDWIYDWQPFLSRGLLDGVFRGGELALDLVEALRGERPEATDIEKLLASRADWVDDETWGRRMAGELGVESVKFIPHAGFKNVTFVVRVNGLSRPARDTRLITLARRAIAFKKADHVLVEAGTERFLIRLGDICTARIDGKMWESVTPIEESRLAAVEDQGGSLAELLGVEAA